MFPNSPPGWPRLETQHLPSWPESVSGAPGWRAAWAIEIQNWRDGLVFRHHPRRGRETLGRVLKPADHFQWNKGFYAGAYLPGGSVVACSRKILRIRAGGAKVPPKNVPGLRETEGVPLVNLLPLDWKRGYENPSERGCVEHPGTSDCNEGKARPGVVSTHIFTDCKDNLFAQWAPPPGSPVFFHDGSRWRLLGDPAPSRRAETRVPRRLWITAIQPDPWPDYIEFENRRGGQVRMFWNGRAPSVVGRVYQAIRGAGRLDDTGMMLARLSGGVKVAGRVCTNHPGDLAVATGLGVVVPIQTKPNSEAWNIAREVQGGFQIIPLRHAWHGMRGDIAPLKNQPGAALGGAPWMVVGPERGEATPFPEPGENLRRWFERTGVADGAAGIEGMAPLFAGCFSPRYAPKDDPPGPVPPPQRQGYVVRIRRGSGRDWEQVPARRSDRSVREHGFSDLTHIRIYFPTEEPD